MKLQTGPRSVPRHRQHSRRRGLPRVNDEPRRRKPDHATRLSEDSAKLTMLPNSADGRRDGGTGGGAVRFKPGCGISGSRLAGAVAAGMNSSYESGLYLQRTLDASRHTPAPQPAA